MNKQVMKYYQKFHRYNYKFNPPLEEVVYAWFEWEGSIKDDNIEQVYEVMWKALWEQCPPSWTGINTGSQKQNIARGKKHHPQLGWSTVMSCGSISESFNTPVFKKNKDKRVIK